MELREISRREDFSAFYEEKGLLTIEAKIEHLKSVLQILASRSDLKDTPEEELMGLEDFIMSHLWEAFQ